MNKELVEKVAEEELKEPVTCEDQAEQTREEEIKELLCRHCDGLSSNEPCEIKSYE